MADNEIQENLLEALETEDVDRVRDLLNELHPSEIADLLESQPGKAREQIWNLVDTQIEGEVLSHAHDSVRTGLLKQMPPGRLARITRDLDADDLVDILNDLPEDMADSVLLSMDVQNRERLASILAYPEDTAGGLMNIDVVPVRADVTLDVVTRYLRVLGELPEQTDSLMVVDRENHFIGMLALAEILTHKPEATVGELLHSGVEITADTPAEDVARLFEQRDLLSAAVVDEDGVLLGRITIDDVVDVIQEQAEHAVRSMAGLTDDDTFAPVLASAGRRAVWLGINIITAFIAASVIGRFEDTIRQLVALAVLMPVVASMGGVAGNQTLTITIRGLALGHVVRSNVRPLLQRELTIGMLNGVLLALVVALIAFLWFHNSKLSLVIGAAMIINLIIGALAGALIPLILKRLGIDPAVAGGMLLMTVTDVVGFLSFLGLATLFLID
ncbi:MAG: magnesium transporter [Gammaproteobacteria bacterium]